MLRAYLTDQKRCYLHAHRTVTTACARCRTPYCDECLSTRTDGLFAQVVARDERHPPPLFCARCVEEVEALAALEAERKRPFWQRWRPTRAGLHRAAIYAAVITAVLVPIILVSRNLATTPLTPEEFARFKFGLMGGFQTQEGTNFLNTVYGGRFIRASAPSAPGRDPSRLIDTWANVEVPGWRSQDAQFPQELVFALPRQLLVNKVILLPHPLDPAETWVNEFEVLVSTQSAESGFTPVLRGALSLEQGRAVLERDSARWPRFEFPETSASYVMLRVLSNHGSAEYTSLAEFEVYWVKK